MAPEQGTQSFKVVLPEELSRYYEYKGNVLGSGGFAKVVLARHVATGEKVAIKVMNKKHLEQKGDLHRAYNEIYALEHLRQQNICQLYEVYENEQFIYLVIEHCPGGELFDYIVSKKRLLENEARHLFRQILSAVAYIHSHGYAHRDLKPENMLLDENKNIKLIDFGLSAKPEHGLRSALKTRAGSALYASPELISGEPYYGNATDVWSLGVVLYALLCGFLPFDHESTTELYRRIKKGEYAKPMWLSSRSMKLLSGMLEIDPKKRLTVEKILKHEWMMVDYVEPPPPPKPLKREDLDYRVVQLLSSYFTWSLADTEAKILKFRYNQLTAFYFILCKMPRDRFHEFCQEYLHRDHFIGEANSSWDKDTRFEIIYRTDTPQSPYSTHHNKNNTQRCMKTRSNTIDTHSKPVCTGGQIRETDGENKQRSKSLDSNTVNKNDKITSRTSHDTQQKHKQQQKQLKSTGSDSTFKDLLYANTIDRLRSRRRANTLGASVPHSNEKSVQLKCVHRSRDNLESIDESDSNKYKGFYPKHQTNLCETKRLASSCMGNLNSFKQGEVKNHILDRKLKSLEKDDDSTQNRNFEKRGRTRSLIQLTQRLSGLFKQESKPRLAKGVYHVENTSSLPPQELKRRLSRALDLLVKSDMLTSCSNSEEGYTFKCKLVEEKQTTVFELEICMVPKIQNVIGIRRKRIKGDSWKYKELVELVLSHINL